MPEPRPVVRLDGELYYIKPVDKDKIAFTWDPEPTRKVKNLEILESIVTRHKCGHISLFKPSISEVLACIPKRLKRKVVAFETVPESAEPDFDAYEHYATTILYKRTGK